VHPPTAARLQTTLALLGVGATALATGVVATALDGHAQAPAAACRGFVAEHLTIGWVLVALLALLVAAVAVRAVWALTRGLRAHRRVAVALARLPREQLAGGPVAVLADPRPLAFCAGLLRPRVVLSTGALALLDRDELHAVLTHERHHAARRDPLRRLLSDVLAASLFFLPVLRPLATRASALAELRADAAAVAACGGDPRALASALLTFEEAGDDGGMIEPERIDQLVGQPTPWRAPAAPLLVALAALAAALAVPLLALERTVGARLDLDAFGAPVCLALVVAAPFALAAALVALGARRDPGTVVP
jgi:Zn-dependent protease with chaperone function